VNFRLGQAPGQRGKGSFFVYAAPYRMAGLIPAQVAGAARPAETLRTAAEARRAMARELRKTAQPSWEDTFGRLDDEAEPEYLARLAVSLNRAPRRCAHFDGSAAAGGTLACAYEEEHGGTCHFLHIPPPPGAVARQPTDSSK
jgi:hypothetical protein